jgi:hypothetical protein
MPMQASTLASQDCAATQRSQASVSAASAIEVSDAQKNQTQRVVTDN